MPRVPADIRGDGLAQFGSSPAWARSASSLRPAPFGRFDNMRGSREIGLADLQVHDITAGSLKILCPHQNFERRFYGKPIHPVCKFHVVFVQGRADASGLFRGFFRF